MQNSTLEQSYIQGQNIVNNDFQQQLNFIKRKLNERTALSNLSNYANIAERISKGNINIEIDSVNKIVTFGSGTNKLWMNVVDKTLNNVNSIHFQNCQLDGLITPETIVGAIESPNSYINHAISAKCVIDFINESDEKYAAKEHEHNINDVTNLQDELDSKADSNHNHDDTYPLLSNVVSQISNTVTDTDNLKITNVIAIRAYCADFLTANDITNNVELQTLLRGATGKSAFEVWKDNQPAKLEDEPDYTFNDFMVAITGAIGPKGDKGDTGDIGLSAYEIWCSLIEPLGYDANNNPVYPNESYFIQSLHGADGSDGENFIDWYCRIKELSQNEIENLTWRDICNDIVKSASTTAGSGSVSIWDMVFGIAEVGSTAYTLVSCKTDITALQGQIAALQSQIFVVQGAVGSILSSSVADETLEAFEEVVDNVQDAAEAINGSRGSNMFSSIGNFFSNIGNVFSRLRPSINAARTTVSGSVLHSSLLGAGITL